jgi:hypothetical protein
VGWYSDRVPCLCCGRGTGQAFKVEVECQRWAMEQEGGLSKGLGIGDWGVLWD